MGTFAVTMIIAILGAFLPSLKEECEEDNLISLILNIIIIGSIISIWPGWSFNGLWLLTLGIAMVNAFIMGIREAEFTHGGVYTVCITIVSMILLFSDISVSVNIVS